MLPSERNYVLPSQKSKNKEFSMNFKQKHYDEFIRAIKKRKQVYTISDIGELSQFAIAKLFTTDELITIANKLIINELECKQILREIKEAY